LSPKQISYAPNYNFFANKTILLGPHPFIKF
jgi:hypothetical protein